MLYITLAYINVESMSAVMLTWAEKNYGNHIGINEGDLHDGWPSSNFSVGAPAPL